MNWKGRSQILILIGGMQEKFAVKFVEKMQDFFQELRDMCRDFIIQLPKQQQQQQQQQQLVQQQQQQQSVNGEKIQRKEKEHGEMRGIKQESRVEQSNNNNNNNEEISKPKSGFMYYYQIRKQKYQKEFPKMSYKEIIEKVKGEWEKLGKQQQEEYMRLASEDMRGAQVKKRGQSQSEEQSEESASYGDVIHKSVKN